MHVVGHDYTVLIRDDQVVRTGAIASAMKSAGVRVRSCYADTGVIFADMSSGDADTVRNIQGVDTVTPGKALHLFGGHLSVNGPRPSAVMSATL